MMPSKSKSLESKVIKGYNYKATEKEKKLYDWAYPFFEEHFNMLKNDTTDAKFVLVVAEAVERAYHAATYSSSKKVVYHTIGLPAKWVEAAKSGLHSKIILYSKKRVPISIKTYLNYMIAHELSHCFYRTEEPDLNEAIAMKTGHTRVMQCTADGEVFTAAVISQRLVEANLLNYVDVLDVSKIILPYKLSGESLKIIQGELDYYAKNPDDVKRQYYSKKGKCPVKGQSYEDNYSKGFARMCKFKQ